MYRRALLVLTLILICSLLVGCGGAGATSSIAATESAPTIGGAVASTGNVQSDAAPAATMPTPTPGVPTPTPTPGSTAEPTGIGGPTIDLRWEQAIHTDDGGMIGVVGVDVLNVRTAPHLDAPIARITYQGHPITVHGSVPGDTVEGNPNWYQVGDHEFVAAAMVEPFIPPPPKTSHEGHWVDINLGTFYAVAYDGNKPVHVAIIIAGLDDHKTPIGDFNIIYRVRNETMDAATVGVKKGQPGYYYLPNVEYTQYFADGGYAIHGNYWSEPWQYGRYGSHGCINLMNDDAAWFWDFLDVGSTVSVHY